MSLTKDQIQAAFKVKNSNIYLDDAEAAWNTKDADVWDAGGAKNRGSDTYASDEYKRYFVTVNNTTQNIYDSLYFPRASNPNNWILEHMIPVADEYPGINYLPHGYAPRPDGLGWEGNYSSPYSSSGRAKYVLSQVNSYSLSENALFRIGRRKVYWAAVSPRSPFYAIVVDKLKSLNLIWTGNKYDFDYDASFESMAYSNMGPDDGAVYDDITGRKYRCIGKKFSDLGYTPSCFTFIMCGPGGAGEDGKYGKNIFGYYTSHTAGAGGGAGGNFMGILDFTKASHATKNTTNVKDTIFGSYVVELGRVKSNFSETSSSGLSEPRSILYTRYTNQAGTGTEWRAIAICYDGNEQYQGKTSFGDSIVAKNNGIYLLYRTPDTEAIYGGAPGTSGTDRNAKTSSVYPLDTSNAMSTYLIYRYGGNPGNGEYSGGGGAAGIGISGRGGDKDTDPIAGNIGSGGGGGAGWEGHTAGAQGGLAGFALFY